MRKDGVLKLSLACTYDDVANVKTIYDSLLPGTETYTYDWPDRLRTASGGAVPTLSYGYDEVGN